ncbi:unnamed protein product [Hymenolepis diminuta]|uniref:Uncharacterized protein n=1 Tax=Hymenolepis diminuta TaxID=6216 RepID=A0A564YWK3_HYMDI|nr:unnamed protein product [Hymenolepis diminuta]
MCQLKSPFLERCLAEHSLNTDNQFGLGEGNFRKLKDKQAKSAEISSKEVQIKEDDLKIDHLYQDDLGSNTENESDSCMTVEDLKIPKYLLNTIDV